MVTFGLINYVPFNMFSVMSERSSWVESAADKLSCSRTQHSDFTVGETRTSNPTIPICADPEGEQGVQTPLENHKNVGFFSNTGPDPLKNHKATKLAFNIGPSSARQRNAI